MSRDADKVSIFVLQGNTMEVCMDEAEREKPLYQGTHQPRYTLHVSSNTPCYLLVRGAQYEILVIDMKALHLEQYIMKSG